MKEFLKNRILKHWQTTMCAALLLTGYVWFHTGKINWTDFKEYLVLIPTIILLLMKDFKKDEGNS